MAIPVPFVVITLLVILLIMFYLTSNIKNLIKNKDSKTNNTVEGNVDLTNNTVEGNVDLTNNTVEGNVDLTNNTVEGNVDLEMQRRIRDMESEIKIISSLTSDTKRSIWDFMISRKYVTESGMKTKNGDENTGHGKKEIMENECSQNSLPFELMADILSRLPVKTLAKSRCVCTQWNTLLNYSNYFIMEHHKKALHGRPMLISSASSNNNMIPLFSFTEEDEINDCSVKQIAPLRNCKVSNPVHGLVCLFEKYSSKTEDQYLFNPTTWEIARLPKQNGSMDNVCTCSVGLGYDEEERAYKIVKMTEKHSGTGCFCEVLTIGAKEWRFVDETSFVVLYDRQCCFSNGRLHWLTMVNKNPLSLGVLSFDMKQEKLSMNLIAMEFDSETICSEIALTVSDNRFYLLQDSNKRLQIWDLQRNNNVSLRGKILLSTDMSSYVPKYTYKFQLAYVDVHGKKALFHRTDGLYYFHNAKLLKVYSVVNPMDIQWLHIFAESLVSPRRLLNDSLLL